MATNAPDLVVTRCARRVGVYHDKTVTYMYIQCQLADKTSQH